MIKISKTPDIVAKEILAKLAVTAPGFSLELGTPERKIVDAVAEAISEAYIDQYLVGSLLDIESKAGLELEQFCLVPGTPVTTPAGVRVIESLRPGDEVITHTGKVAEVLATSSRPVDEPVVTIRTAVGVKYTMTRNHPVWITRRADMTMLASQVGNWRRDSNKGSEYALRLRGLGSRTVWDSRGLDRDFVPAGQVREGDIVWGPDSGPAGTENTLSVSLKRLLGYYLAEGHTTHRERSSEIGFSFHRDEVEYQDEVESLLRSEWGITHVRRTTPGDNSVQLICYNTRLARWLEDFVGKGAENKHIPFGMDDEDWTPLIATYWRGDGTAAPKQSLRAKTVSPTLAWQLYDQMVRHGLSPRLTKQSTAGSAMILGRKCQRRETWQVSVDGESAAVLSEMIDYPLRHRNTKNYAPASVRLNGFVGSPVVKVTESQHRGMVHNIEVAGDNSYELLGSFGVHNCGIFGFGRLQGRRAVGTVRVELNTANAQDISIPNGSQFYTRQSLPGTGNPLYFSSTQAVVIPAGSYVIDVPVECTDVGTSGNVPPDSVVYVGDVLGATSVTNLQSFTGGVNVETDDELRQRFKDTFLRSVIGTEDWYLGLAYQNKNISKAACFGPIRKYATQIVVPNTSMTLDDYITDDIKYAWDGDWHVSVFKNLGQEYEVFYRRNVDYSWIAGSSPSFGRIASGDMEEGDVVDLEFEYTTRSSRNEPVNGITNKIDLFVNGADPYTVTERTKISATTTLSTDADSRLYIGNFARVGTPGNPGDGEDGAYTTHRFTRLGSTPVWSFPSIITVTTTNTGASGGIIKTNYQQGVDYHLLRPAPEVTRNSTTLLAGSPYEIAGIEWTATGPASGTPVTLTYTYNRVPEVLQATVKTAKQVSTDVMVHQAGYQYIRVYLSVEYDRGFVVQQVNNAINERLKTYFAGIPYGGWVEISDLTLAVHQVLGVDNVRLTYATDDGVNLVTQDYGIKTYGDSTDVNLSTTRIDPSNGDLLPYEDDFKLRDNQLPVFLEAVVRRRANR